MKESDNLVSLHSKVRECDTVLTHMEALLGGFQADLGSISSEIKSLQEQCMSMGIKHKNRKAALTQLLLYYTRLCDSLKCVGDGVALSKDVISIPSIMYEIKKYSRTF